MQLSIGPHYDLVPHQASEFASADVDVRDGDKQPANAIYARGTGTLILVTESGQTRTFDVVDGWMRVLQVRTIKQNTDVDVEVGYADPRLT